MDETRWRKPARSNGANTCVELHPDGAVRDSKHPGPTLPVDVHALARAVKSGALTRS